MQARRRIQHEAPRWQLDIVRAVGILDQQLAALILLGITEKQRRREIRADPVSRPADLPDRVVRVAPERLASVANIFGDCVILRQLGVELDASGLIARRDPAVNPVGGRERRARGAICSAVKTSGMCRSIGVIRACRPVL